MKFIISSFLAYLAFFVLWRYLQPSGIVFYQGVFLAVIVSFVQVVLQRYLKSTNWSNALKDGAFAFLLIYCFVFTVPTTVDRAYSVRMILQVARSPAGLSRDEIENWFSQDFRTEAGVEKRLREQMATGSLVMVDGKYLLTPLGKTLAQSFRFLQWLFSTQRQPQ